MRIDIAQPWVGATQLAIPGQNPDPLSVVRLQSPVSRIAMERLLPTGDPGSFGAIGRTPQAPDLLFLSYGAGAVEGHVVGERFSHSPTQVTRASFVPEGCDGFVRFRRPA